MNSFFYFGEKIEGYSVRVLNEREVRAGAGIVFLFAITSFLNAWLLGDFKMTQIFVTFFLIDFFIRIFINPKYAPSLILGRFAVHKQKVEYVGAVQKRFAWSIGFLLAATMFYLVVINNIIGPINLFTCLACLIFLFFEAAFGICIGCKLFNFVSKRKSQLCAGATCDALEREDIQRISWVQILITVVFISLVIFVSSSSFLLKTDVRDKIDVPTSSISKKCTIPDWVKKIGHEEKYKLHHNCQ
jgi:hypothetical protein